MADRFLLRRLVALSMFAVSGGIASAAATNWQSVGAGDWFLGANWDAGVPDGTSTVIIGNGGAAQVGSGSAGVLSLEIGAALDNALSGTVTVAGGSLTSPTLSVGAATSVTNGVTATGTGTLDMLDTVFSAPGLLQIGVSSTTYGGSAAVSTGRATLSGGTATVGDLQVGDAVGRGDHAADGVLRFEDVTFTGAGAWTIGNAVRTWGGNGTVAVDRAEVVIEGDDASTANLTSLSIGAASATRDDASANASFSFTGRSVTADSLSVGTAIADNESASSQVHEASATFDADLTVTGNASVGTGSSTGNAGIEDASLTIASGHHLDVAGGLTIGSASIGGHTGTLSIASSAVTLGEGADLSVGGLLTIGQIHDDSYRSAVIDDAHLTLEGGSAALNGGLVVGRATADRMADVSVSGRLSLDGTTFTAAGAWTVGDVSVDSYTWNSASATSTAEVTIAGDAASIVDLTSLVVGTAWSGDDDTDGVVSVTADLTLSGGTASVGGLQVGAAAASFRGGATADASVRLSDMTFTGSGVWAIGKANKSGDAPVGTAAVNQATLIIEGDESSAADLDGLSVGTANTTGGTAWISDSRLSFSGRSVATTSLSIGTAASGSRGNAQVDAASAVFDADLIVAGDTNVGVGSADAENSGSTAIANAGLTVEAGHVFDVGGALTVGNGVSGGHAGTSIAGPAVTLGEDVDFHVGGLLTIGRSVADGYDETTVTDAHLTLTGGSASLDGGLAVGLATANRIGDAVVSARLSLDGTSFSGSRAWKIGEAVTASGSHSDAIVNNADVSIGGDGTSDADLTSVIVGHARSDGTNPAQVTASLTYSGGAFSSSDGLVAGWAEAGKANPLVQATGSATFRDVDASVRSLHVGQYTGVGTENPSSFAHGSLTLADSIMTVDEDAELAYLTAGVGSATAGLSLTRSLLDVEGNLLLGDGSELLFQIDGYDEFGRIEAGAASLDGDLTIAFDFTLTETGYWDLIALDDGSSFVGDFDSGEVLGLSAETTWSLGFATNDFGQAVYRLAITGVSPAPISAPAPGAIALLSLGVGIALAHRRRG